jgi:hypothetical protein
MGRMPQSLPQYTPPGPVEQMPNMASPQQCSELAKVHSNAVFPYQPNEIATSRTEVGHLGADVAMVPPGAAMCQYLVIWDFGVDWRHLKTTAKLDPLLVLHLNRFETDKSLQFQIVGYSDCVGAERNNLFLRTGRARNVFHLLGPSARSRVFAVKGAPPHEYLKDNSTVLNRAANRAVVIEIFAGGTRTI